MHGGPRINRAWLAIPYGESGRRLETNFATVSFLVQTSPRICTNFQVDKVWRFEGCIFQICLQYLQAKFPKEESDVSNHDWWSWSTWSINQQIRNHGCSKPTQSLGIQGSDFVLFAYFKDFSEEYAIGSRCERQWCCKYKSTRDAAGRSRREEE